jgi:CDP-diacylglycerol--serine O-phosphatidyltransferase
MFTIPNIVSLLNLACGCVAAAAAMHGHLFAAFWWVAAAAVFDFLDGLVARLTRQYSDIGRELDSLCDVVSFGVAPAAVLAAMGGGWWAIALVLFSALRLAKFNVDTSQKDSFVGLPTPACALLVCSLGAATVLPQWAVYALLGVLCVLLVCPLRMFSLKFAGFGWRGNELRYCFLMASAAAIAVLGVAGVAIAIGGYVAVSAIIRIFAK